MRRKTTVYCYQHKELIDTANSIREAARLAGVSDYLVQTILDNQTRCTKQGWFFSLKKLEDTTKCPDKEEETNSYNLQRFGEKKLAKVIGKQVYEVQHQNGFVTDIPRKREDKKERLKQIIAVLCKDRWMKISPSRVALERQGLKELIDSL